jgi:hypothetical protein
VVIFDPLIFNIHPESKNLGHAEFEGAALQTEVQAPGGERTGQLLFPHQGHKSQHPRPAAAGNLERGCRIVARWRVPQFI